MVLHLDRGDEVDQRILLRRLAELQYQRNELEFKRSMYRVRGDVIDVFPADSEKEALRIELFGNEIDSLKLFDPLTGEIIREVPRITIYPKSHYVTSREKVLQAIDFIKEELGQRLAYLRKENKLVEAQRLEERTKYDIEMLKELGFCSGIENYSRFLSDRQPGEPPPTLYEYLPEDALVFIDESHVSLPQLGGMYRGDRSRKQTLVDYGFRLPVALDNRPLRFDEWEKLSGQRIFLSATPSKYELENSGNVVELVARPTGLTDPEVEIKPATHQVDVLVGINLLREGLDIPEVALVAVLDADKEGFLRSESSLIQTIGRAARHLQGKAILYADKVTGSMERAIEETNRRRTIQEKFNKENSIKPKGIKKNIADIMEGARSVKGKGKTKRKLDKLSDIKFEPVESFDNPEKVRKEIIKLEDEMYKYAKNLEFEEAATYRDRVEELKKQLLLS